MAFHKLSRRAKQNRLAAFAVSPTADASAIG